jgi:hypothetical protein
LGNLAAADPATQISIVSFRFYHGMSKQEIVSPSTFSGDKTNNLLQPILAQVVRVHR